METQLEIDLKARMGYKDAHVACAACKHYVPTDCSGSHNAKNQHCTLNPAVELPVQEHGWCKFHACLVKATTSFSDVEQVLEVLNEVEHKHA